MHVKSWYARMEFIAEAHKLRDMRIPFRHQGRALSGMDCLGVFVYVAAQRSIKVQDNLKYGRVPNHATMEKGLRAHFNFIPRTHVIAGDAFWIKWKRTAYPMHLALVTGFAGGDCPVVLHADGEAAKMVVEHTMPESWRELIVTGLRWKHWDG